MKLTDFSEITQLVTKGEAGSYDVDAGGSYNGGLLGKLGNLSSAATVGGLKLQANGILAIAGDGSYQSSGNLSANPDVYDFNPRTGRSWWGDASTMVGRYIPGKAFVVHLIGSKPFEARGRR